MHKITSDMVTELEELDRFRACVEDRLTETERIKCKVEYKLISLNERKDKLSQALSDVSDEIMVLSRTR